MRKITKAIILLWGGICLYGCDGVEIVGPPRAEKGPTYQDFTRNRKECKQLAEKFCSFPLANYCTLDVYEKRIIFIKNCMYERGWNDPYNVFSYYK